MPLALRLRAVVLVLVCCAIQAGCVQRRLTIRTDPTGALVYVDDYEIGTTPCSTNFTYYGKRKIRLVKDGYETLTVDQRIWPPWYEIFPLEFVSENLVPWEIRDDRALSFRMVPQQLTPVDQLLERAENLRLGSRSPVAAQANVPAAAVTLPTEGAVPQPTRLTPPPQALPPGGYSPPNAIPQNSPATP